MLIAFDVDGTLETSGGPVKIERLNELIDDGAKIAIVSPSPSKPSGFIEINSGDRFKDLQHCKKDYPDEEIYLYVSDNLGDDWLAMKAGFTFVKPKDFK